VIIFYRIFRYGGSENGVLKKKRLIAGGRALRKGKWKGGASGRSGAECASRERVGE